MRYLSNNHHLLLVLFVILEEEVLQVGGFYATHHALWGTTILRDKRTSSSSAVQAVGSNRNNIVRCFAHQISSSNKDNNNGIADTAEDDDSWEEEELSSTPDDDDDALGERDADDCITAGGGEAARSVAEKIHDTDDAASVSSDEHDPLKDEYDRWCGAVDASLESLEKKENSLRNELRKAEKLEETISRAQLLTSYLYLFNDAPGASSAVVRDWDRDGAPEVEITLDPSYESASAEANALFDKAKKLKRGSVVIRDLLEDTATAASVLREIKTDLLSAATSDRPKVNEEVLRFVQRRLEQTARQTNFRPPPPARVSPQGEQPKSKQQQQRQQRSKKKPELGTPASNVRKLTSPGGCTVLVGRNRRGNEYLTFTVCRQKDIWMHARGCPGAHVVILQRRGGPPATPRCWQYGADLAVFYSDARSERSAPVTAAEPKHLLKPRGAGLGAVKLREEYRVLPGRPENVPDELKFAREESGFGEEYRSADKGKHKRRTTERRQEEKRRRRKQRQQSSQEEEAQ